MPPEDNPADEEQPTQEQWEAFAKQLVSDNACPKCLGELDEGWECNECGYDAKPLATKDDSPDLPQ